MESSLPNGWEESDLSFLVEYKKGKKPKRLEREPFKNSLVYLDIKAIEKGKDENFVDRETSRLTTEEELIMVWDGARSGWVAKSRDGALGSTLMALKPKIDLDYLFRFLQTQFDYLQTNHRGTGIPHVDPDLLWRIKVPIAPLPEQQRIVAKLDALMEKIERSRVRLEKIPIILKRFRQSILSAAVSGKLTEEWRERSPNQSGVSLLQKSYEKRLSIYEKELKQAKKNNTRKPSKPVNFEPIDIESGQFPVNWAITTPGLIASPERYSLAIGPFGSNLKVSDYKTSGVPLVFVRHIKSNDFIGQNPKFVSKKKASELIPHSVSSMDLLVTKMGEPPGDCEIYPAQSPDAIITADCLKFRVWDKFFNRVYFKYVINSFFIKEQLGLITQGVAQQKISLERFKTLHFPIPSKEEQDEIVRKVEELFSLADKIEDRYLKAKSQLDKLPQSLLAKAFRGELVAQDPNDEPASELLQRMKSEREKKVKASKGKRRKLKGVDLEEIGIAAEVQASYNKAKR